MSHKIYHTEGFIIGSSNIGEANRYISIFTKDLGLIQAVAQGVRKISSKLKFSLQDLSYSKIDLVRGERVWRLTNAEKLPNFDQITKDRKLFPVFYRILKILRRLCPGEEPNELLFEELSNLFSFAEGEDLSSGDLECFEAVSLLRILSHLGYVGDSAEISSFIKRPMSKELIVEASQKKRTIVSEINKSLKESQL